MLTRTHARTHARTHTHTHTHTYTHTHTHTHTWGGGGGDRWNFEKRDVGPFTCWHMLHGMSLKFLRWRVGRVLYCPSPTPLNHHTQKRRPPPLHPKEWHLILSASDTLLHVYIYIYVMSAWQQRQHVPPVMAAPFSSWRSTVCGQHQRLPPPHHGTPLRTPSLPPGAVCTGLQCSPAHHFQVLGQIWKGQGSGKHWYNNSSKNNRIMVINPLKFEWNNLKQN